MANALRWLLLACILSLASHGKAAIINASSCSASDVQAAIFSALDGDSVLVPSGRCAWASGVAISGKAIAIRGAGSGRIIGQSTSTVAVGTGSKTFITASGLPITTGQTLRVFRTGDRATFMQGTVTSYGGTTLTMNITDTGIGSKPQVLWVISTVASTVITNNSPSALLTVTENTSASVELSGIKIEAGTGRGNGVRVLRQTNGKPVLIHDCWMEIGSTSSAAIYTNSNQGVIWNCSFDASPFSQAPLAIQHLGASDSWTTPALWGAQDTTGTHALYVEDSDFHAFLNAVDNDDNGRIVLRHSLFNNAGFATHGADTSNYGQRYFEVYDNNFVFNAYKDGSTFNVNWWFLIRGGSAVITGNMLPDITSQDYGDKTEVVMAVWNLAHNAGPHPCWGNGTPGGSDYPAPRQVGMGRVSGARSSDGFTYNGDSEPIYIWNNSDGYRVGTSDYRPPDAACTSPDTAANYVLAGRDYFDNETPKPGYTKYSYPHPLRDTSASPPPAPTGLSVR